MDERTRDLIDYTILYASLGLLVLAVVGEILGWWADLGIVLTIASLVGTVFAAFDIYGRKGLSELGAIRRHVGGLRGEVGGLREEVRGLAAGQERMLENQDAQLSKLDRTQEAMDQRLPGGS